MLKVMTFNINFYVEKHGPWPERKALIQEALEAYRPDVLALQAVKKDPALYGGMDQAAQLCEAFPEFRSVLFQPAKIAPDGSAEGSALLTRLPLVDAGHLPLTLIPGLEDPFSRVLLHARLDLPGGPFHLFNAHFSWVAEQSRMNVEETLPYLTSFQGPALLVGDLNTPAGESGVLEHLAQSGWVDAWASLRPGESGFTFESNAPSIRIDYAWASPELVPYLQRIEIVANRTSDSGFRASDHFGLLVTLSL